MPKTARRRVQPDDIYLFETVGDPQLSPDGKRVAYVVSVPDREDDETRMSVYVAPMDGQRACAAVHARQEGPQPALVAGRPYLAFVSGPRREEPAVPRADGRRRGAAGHAGEVGRLAAGVVAGREAESRTRARTGDYKEPKERKTRRRRMRRASSATCATRLDGIGFFDNAADAHLRVRRRDRRGDSRSRTATTSTISRRGRRRARRSPSSRTGSAQRNQRHWRTDVWTVPAPGRPGAQADAQPGLGRAPDVLARREVDRLRRPRERRRGRRPRTRT